jgi:hypothetical protein
MDIHKHDLQTALSNARELFSLIHHYSDDMKVACMKQYMVNILAYLETEKIVSVSEAAQQSGRIDSVNRIEANGPRSISEQLSAVVPTAANNSLDAICPFYYTVQCENKRRNLTHDGYCIDERKKDK